MIDFSCPVPDQGGPLVTLAHGSGGKTMHDFIAKIIAPMYPSGSAPDHDGAVLDIGGRVAYTTDSYVVNPLFFAGGDIGKLAVYGTVNDLAMCGATAKFLSCSLILEEGLALNIVEEVCTSIAKAAQEAKVKIVTGDTKVVGRGQADKLFINTSGIGEVWPNVDIHPRRITIGDRLIVSGDLGRHGAAVLSARNGQKSGDITSDCALLSEPVLALLGHGIEIHCLRDLTRGGLAAALHEFAQLRTFRLDIQETSIPVCSEVRAIAEILGLDPIYMANEGRFVAVAPEQEVDVVLSLLHRYEVSKGATVIGEVTAGTGVELVSAYGSRRFLPPMVGELLPRIC